MIGITRLVAAGVAVSVAGLLALPASAQYANEYAPPKLIAQAKTSHPIAGTGTVIVQVQVNANGTHKAVKIIKSTNSGDNAAAMDIANRSTYRVARRGKTPVTAFYDFTLKFKGKSVASSVESSSAASAGGTAGQIDRMIQAHNYAGAKAAAEAALAKSPNDPTLNSELGAANYFLSDYPGAAAAFDKVPTPTKEFADVAAQSYVMAAGKLASTNPSQAVAYGQKGVALKANGGAYYALGVAQMNANDAAAAVTNLKKARDLAFADAKTSVKDRVTIDSALYSAQSAAKDEAGAAATAAEIKKLDPTSDIASVSAANKYMTQGNTAAQAGKHDEAIAAYLQAAQAGGSKAAVTAYTAAAFEESKLDKPDYAKMKSYADKALAAGPNDPQALYAEGVALYGQYANGGKVDNAMKQKALDTLNKAKAAAQSSGNIALSLNIDNFIKQYFK